MSNATSRPTSVLLDKSVVREALRGLQRLRGRHPLPERQRFSLTAIVTAQEQQIRLEITEQLLHILRRPGTLPVAQLFLPYLQVLAPGRYLRRWARRLREEGLSREDAVIVSHASFGVSASARLLGSEVVLTTDYALKARYEHRLAQISARFERMTRQLGQPYRDATLPAILRPDELLDALLR